MNVMAILQHLFGFEMNGEEKSPHDGE